MTQTQTVRLGDLLASVSSGAVTSRSSDGHFPLYGSTGPIGRTNDGKYNGESVLVARVGANAGSIYRVDGTYGVTDNTLILRPDKHLNLEYLAQLLDYLDLNTQVYGSGQPLITGRILKALEVPVLGYAEQELIVEALSDADLSICSLQRLIAKKRAIKQGMMQELLTGRTRLPGFSGGWAARKFSELVGIRSGQVDPRLPAYKHLPLIAPDHIESGTGRLLDVRTAEQQSAISGKYLVDPGDIIYSKIRPNLQKVYMAEFPALCSADMYPLKPRPGMDGRFIVSTLLGRDFTDFAVGASMRSGIPKINRTELAGFELAMPPMDEQRQIGKALADVDDLIASLERRLESTRAIKQGMMQELLTGRTRLVATEASA